MLKDFRLYCSMGDEPIDPINEEEWVDYIKIGGGKILLCLDCLNTIISAAKTEGMID